MEKEKNILNHLNPVKVEVPDRSFFDEMTKKVIKENQRKEIRLLPSRKQLIYIITSAAAILILMLYFLKDVDHSECESVNTISFADFNDDELIRYIKDNPHENIIDSHSISDSTKKVKSGVVDKGNNKKELNKIFSELSEQEILQYLESEGIDPEESEEGELF